MLIPSPTPVAIARAAEELSLEDDQVLMVLIGEREHPELRSVVGALAPLGIEFFGGLFAGLIDGDRRLEKGALLLPLPAISAPLLVTGLDRPHIALPELGKSVHTPPGEQTAIVLVDGLGANVSLLLSELHKRLGNSVHYIGGGAGSLTLVQKPCVFTREGVFENAAVIGLAACRSRLGVRHGWKRLDGPVVATSTKGNVIQELNWRTAFDVYRDSVQPFTDRELTPENFFEVSNAFPFGIYKEGSEDIVRDPISVGPRGELNCVGEVPENAVLNILRGDRDSLIAAAERSAEDCCIDGPIDSATAFVVDCVSRTIFLGEAFDSELAAVHRRLSSVTPNIPVQGMLSLGEVSSHGEGFVEFFNKTIVTAVLHG